MFLGFLNPDPLVRGTDTETGTDTEKLGHVNVASKSNKQKK
jgi:hypothetical protein